MQNYIELDEEMEMPTPCLKCGEWFGLNDGCGSAKWFPHQVICKKCKAIEDAEIERDEEIEDINNQVSDALWDLRDATERLTKLGEPAPKTELDADTKAKITDALYWANYCNDAIPDPDIIDYDPGDVIGRLQHGIDKILFSLKPLIKT